MKFFPSIFFLLVTFRISAQQTSFLDVPDHTNNKDFSVPIFTSSLAEIFSDLGSVTKITIFPEDLDSASHYDFSKLVNLEVVHVQFSFSPDSSDKEKKIFREKMKNELLSSLPYFSKCPKLRIIIFGIGEQIYLNQKDCEPKGLEKQDNALHYKRMAKTNMKNAWNDFGKDLQPLLPGVKLYAYDWGW